jgi:hypothetical protein
MERLQLVEVDVVWVEVEVEADGGGRSTVRNADIDSFRHRISLSPRPLHYIL